MKRKSRKLALKKSDVRTLDADSLRRIEGAGYGFSLNRNNCGTLVSN